MKVKVRFFAALRESLGLDALEVELQEKALLSELIEQLCQMDSKWQQLAADHLLMAVNQQMAQQQTELCEGDEVAFFPPVTGG